MDASFDKLVLIFDVLFELDLFLINTHKMDEIPTFLIRFNSIDQIKTFLHVVPC